MQTAYNRGSAIVVLRSLVSQLKQSRPFCTLLSSVAVFKICKESFPTFVQLLLTLRDV